MKKLLVLTAIISVLISVFPPVCFAAGNGVEGLYEDGMEYYEKKDYVSAIARFYVAGEARGYAPAQNMLGVCYRDGLGTEKDLEEAERYFKLSADQGYGSAKDNLASLEAERDAAANEKSNAYQDALNLYFSGDYEAAKAAFEALGNYERSADFIAMCEENLKEKQEENQPSLSAETGGSDTSDNLGYFSSESPKNVVVELNENYEPVIKWDAVPGAVSYTVSRTNEQGIRVLSKTQDTSMKSSLCSFGGTYSFCVSAVFPDRTESEYSETVSITIPKVEEIGTAPEIDSVNLQGHLVQIVWEQIPGASSYEVYRSEDNESFTRIGYGLPSTTYTCKTCTPGKTYSFKVIAILETGTKSQFSEAATVCVPDTQKQPYSPAEELSEERHLFPEEINVGDVLTFGSYEQDNNIPNGKEPIKWLVIDEQDGEVLLVSRFLLDRQPYYTSSKDDITWKTCMMRTWLNETFYEEAFSSEEKILISAITVDSEGNQQHEADEEQDRVFLLSVEEAEKYFDSKEERRCELTAYAEAQGCRRNWWLRSLGSYFEEAVHVDSNGYINKGNNFGYGGYYGNVAVRPALWLDVN